MTSLDRAAQSSFPWGKGGAASGAAACGSTVSKGTKFPDESLPWGFTEETPHSQCPRGTWQGFTTAPHSACKVCDSNKLGSWLLRA